MQTRHHPLEQITPVMNGDDVLDLQEEIKNVRVDDVLLDYLMEIVTATRNSEMLDMGVSPRGSLALRPRGPGAGLHRGPFVLHCR